jgi:hypothetical protein
VSPYTELELEYTTRRTPACRAASRRRTVAFTFASCEPHESLDRARHAAERGQVEHHVHAVQGAAAHGRVLHVALDELRPGQRGQVRAVARGQVVEHAHGVPQREQPLGDVRTDEPGAAGDETAGGPGGGDEVVGHGRAI